MFYENYLNFAAKYAKDIIIICIGIIMTHQ